MTTGTGTPPDPGADDVDEPVDTSLAEALLVYAEPLADRAFAIVIGDAESPLAARLLELGARGVNVFDPDPARAANAARSAPRGVVVRALVDDLEVRDGAFDLAVIPDLSELNDPRGLIARLRRAVAASGAVVAMGRAKLPDDDGDLPFSAELGPAALEYSELYDLFAVQFDEVSLAGVVPFRGVVFAELGREEEDAPAVTVDGRLAPASPPTVFVVVAAQHHAARPELDPYAIVQVPSWEEELPESTLVLEAECAAVQLKADLLASQVEDARDRLVVADVRIAEASARLERSALERDGALTRAMELEAVLAASQQTMATLERRLLAAEQGLLERDDRLATLAAEIDARRSAEGAQMMAALDVAPLVERAERAESALAVALVELDRRLETAVTPHYEDAVLLRDRAEQAEASLALHVAELLQLAEAHTAEALGYEAQLRDRARVVADLERELIRREQLVKELVVALGEAREALGSAVSEVAATLPHRPTEPERGDAAEVAALRAKLDGLAAEVARREGELVARGWRIQELENALAALPSAGLSPVSTLDAELARTQNELDALRQAFTQEHAARLAAESGEALSEARTELARQAVLIAQMRARS